MPEFRIPDTVIELGEYAFGGNHIEHLMIPSTVRSPYLRQFCACSIDTLSLPMEWKEYMSIEDHSLDLSGALNNSYDDYGFLRWSNTKVGKLEFY